MGQAEPGQLARVNGVQQSRQEVIFEAEGIALGEVTQGF
jgi:hypothetical protein